MNLLTSLVIISEVGQRINLSLCSSDNDKKFGETDDIFPNKQALLRSKIGHDIKKCLSSSISPREQ